MIVRFHPAADAEAEAAQAWYEQRSALAASAFLLELSVAVDRAVEAPYRYPAGLAGIRRVLFDRFPFQLVYRVRLDEVIIIAVAHARRRPGYWLGR
jgi:plasmid stabilization system protein ParE